MEGVAPPPSGFGFLLKKLKRFPCFNLTEESPADGALRLFGGAAGTPPEGGGGAMVDEANEPRKYCVFVFWLQILPAPTRAGRASASNAKEKECSCYLTEKWRETLV